MCAWWEFGLVGIVVILMLEIRLWRQRWDSAPNLTPHWRRFLERDPQIPPARVPTVKPLHARVDRVKRFERRLLGSVDR